MEKKLKLILSIAIMSLCFSSCKGSTTNEPNAQLKEEGWEIEDYAQLDDIINIEEIVNDNSEKVITYNIRYKSDDCEVISYLADTSEKIVFASQYRGVSGGTGIDEFGGNDLHEVLKLIDLCEEFSFVDMKEIYMMGISRGGIMTYMSIREDSRIRKAIVISVTADNFMSWNKREDMQQVYMDLIGKSPTKHLMNTKNAPQLTEPMKLNVMF